MKTLAILFAESEYTPWKENIDLMTVDYIRNLIEQDFTVHVRHMEYPTDYLGKLLRQYDGVINLCYGFMEYSQWEIASWLDTQHVNHFSSPGWIQRQVQDKLWVEKKALQLDLNVPLSIRHDTLLDKDELYILKPRFGSCHHGIHILNGTEMGNLLNTGSFQSHILQEYIAGREFSVAVVPSETRNGYRSLPPVEIVPNTDRTIYIAGSTFGGTSRNFDYSLDNQVRMQMESISESFHQHLGLRYMSRLDFRVRDNKPYILDVNAMPNLHPIKSLLPAMMEYHSFSMKELIYNWVRINSYYQSDLQSNLIPH
jgi:D-alanine-D-alanine ligase